MTIFNRNHSIKLRRQNLVLMITFICLITTLLFQTFKIPVTPEQKIPESEHPHYESAQRIPEEKDKIVIGAVSCRSGDNTKYNHETWVMIKSVLISAQLYQVRLIELHLFLEYLEDEQFFLDQLTETGHISKSTNIKSAHRPQVTVRTHSALDAVPEKYHSDMIYHRRWRCGYVRFFFPDVLPDVDSILYLDSDIIYTGNIRKLWNYLGLMDSQQFVGVAREREPENHEFMEFHNASFGQIPHVPPTGINNGVVVMNLTRMRKWGLSEKICKIRDEYFDRVRQFSGQKALNILLHFHPETMQLIPCQFNFDRCECTRGFFCKGAKTDVYGIQLIHGANRGLESGGIFYPIFQKYQQFDFARDMANVAQKLMKPVRKSFDRPAIDKREKCSGTLNHLLFPNFF